MYKLVFDTLLTPPEWRIIEALRKIKVPTSTKVMWTTIDDNQFSSGRVYQILNHLSSCTLVTRDTVFIDGPFGPERRVLWQLSTEGRRLFT